MPSIAASLLVLALLLPIAVRAAPPGAADLARLESRYAPVELKVELSALAAPERQALGKLVEAARIVDALFLRQVWAGNEALLLGLSQDSSPLGRARLSFFLRNKGPWDRLDRDRPFLPGVPEKPDAASFYPAGATKDEVKAFAASLSPAERAAALGFFTVLRRAPDGRIAVVPYALEYQGELDRGAALLREAAKLTSDPSLRRFLDARAEAFRSNVYADSDVAWMQLDGAVEAAIGPYEVYEDGWFNAKSAFEAILGVRDDAETAKLARLSSELQGIEDALPLDESYKTKKLGSAAPIRVVNEVFAAGDAARGVTPAAYNLPNDEAVVARHGSKRVMLKNVQRAKFEKALVPIARVVLSPADRARVAFDPFFTHILMHELMHGLGPHAIRIGDRENTVRAELGELYSALEEAKADVSGLFALEKLLREGKLDRSMEGTLYPTYLASMFRSIRFGAHEAHGKSTLLQLGWFMDAGAVRVGKDGAFSVDPGKMREAVVALTREIMTIQAKGDRAAAKALLDRYGTPRPEVGRALARLDGIPVDIAPRFVTAEGLSPR